MMGRKPACVAISRQSAGNASGLSYQNERDITVKKTVNQAFYAGNRINHDRFSPKIFMAPSGHKRPFSISDISKQFTDSYFEKRFYSTFYAHKNKEGRAVRLIRSEFREMISMGLSIITHYYDVMTGEIGYRNEQGSFIRYSYEFIADKLSVSLQRVKRFFQYLKNRKFIRVIEDKKKDESGIWKSNISKKIVNASFFIETLGIDAWRKIDRYKQYLLKDRKPKTNKERENQSMVSNIMKSFKPTPKKSASSFETKSSREIHKEQDLLSMALDMYKIDPSKPPSEHLKLLKNTLAKKKV